MISYAEVWFLSYRILQRMDDEAAQYYIAFPDMDVYRNLWMRLPDWAKERKLWEMAEEYEEEEWAPIVSLA